MAHTSPVLDELRFPNARVGVVVDLAAQTARGVDRIVSIEAFTARRTPTDSQATATIRRSLGVPARTTSMAATAPIGSLVGPTTTSCAADGATTCCVPAPAATSATTVPTAAKAMTAMPSRRSTAARTDAALHLWCQTGQYVGEHGRVDVAAGLDHRDASSLDEFALSK